MASPVRHFLRPHFSPAAGRSAFPLVVCDGSSSRTACPASLLCVPLVTALRPSDRCKAGLFPAFIRISLALGNVAPFHVWGRPFRPHPFVIGRLIFPVAGCAGLQGSDVSPWGRQVSHPGGRLAVLLTVSCAQRFLPLPPFLVHGPPGCLRVFTRGMRLSLPGGSDRGRFFWPPCVERSWHLTDRWRGGGASGRPDPARRLRRALRVPDGKTRPVPAAAQGPLPMGGPRLGQSTCVHQPVFRLMTGFAGWRLVFLQGRNFALKENEVSAPRPHEAPWATLTHTSAVRSGPLDLCLGSRPLPGPTRPRTSARSLPTPHVAEASSSFTAEQLSLAGPSRGIRTFPTSHGARADISTAGIEVPLTHQARFDDSVQ